MEQRTYVTFCAKLGKTAAENHRMLCAAFHSVFHLVLQSYVQQFINLLKAIHFKSFHDMF
jgi:hypothetical protein